MESLNLHGINQNIQDNSGKIESSSLKRRLKFILFLIPSILIKGKAIYKIKLYFLLLNKADNTTHTSSCPSTFLISQLTTQHKVHVYIFKKMVTISQLNDTMIRQRPNNRETGGVGWRVTRSGNKHNTTCITVLKTIKQKE